MLVVVVVAVAIVVAIVVAVALLLLLCCYCCCCCWVLQAELLCSYYIGETIHSLHKTTLIPGGSELLVFTTLSGVVGMMVPFTSREVYTHPLPPCCISSPAFLLLGY